MICTTTTDLQKVPEGDLIELRVDLLPEVDFEMISTFRKKVKKPLILTYRGASQETIEKLAKLKPDYIDVDIEGQRPLPESYPEIQWIVSYHNFKEMPEDLDTVLKKLKTFPAALYKIAAKAESTLDTLKMLLWLKKQQNVVALPMGPHGTFGRILAPFLGSKFTFAYHKEPSAPGQLSYDQMKAYYTFKNPSFYGLIGDPVDQSISDITHNRVMKDADLNAVYVKMTVHPRELEKFLDGVKQLDFQGLSATMPLKETLIPLVDELSEEAKAIGAINTLTFKGGKIFADNTDGIGALSNRDLNGKHVIVLGAGGAAKAIIHTALKKGAHVTVLNRTPEKGQELSDQFNIPFFPLAQATKVLQKGYDVLINCTPNPCPIDPDDLLPKKTVIETKTKPKETDLLKAAREKNCPVHFGFEMFVGQAVLQFQTWFPDSKAPFEKLLNRSVLETQF
ncbi:MAG: shikimate dehydrogenase [Chlamydiia bacterium]|nr:shikimate dehydrogenase [Chlamydiia bacterium]